MGGLGNNLSQLFLAFKLESSGYKVEINDFLCNNRCDSYRSRSRSNCN